MEENLSKFITGIGAVLIMLAAIALFFVLYRDSSGTLHIVNHAINDRGVVYQGEGMETKEMVSGADIAGSIRNGLATDIYIDSLYVKAHMDVFHTFNYDLIDSDGLYTVTYHLDDSGEVEYILYTHQQEQEN